MKSIEENNVDGTLGQQLNIKYGYNTTIFTDDYRKKKDIYQFNDYGNTISIRDGEGNAQYYKYNDEGANKNKLNTQSKLQRTVVNYVKNHNAETSSDWGVDYWTGSTGSGEFSSTYDYSGKQSLKINKTNTTSRHYYQQTVYHGKGKTYTFSAYVKTASISTGKGAALFVNYQDGSGEWKTMESDYINGTKNWERQEVKFTLPADALTGAVYVRVGIVEEAGTAYFDCMQLEEGSISNRYNLLENSNFIYGTDTPTFWNKNALCDDSDKLDPQKQIFKMNGEAGSSKNIYQTLNMSGNAKDVFVVSGWAKGDSVELGLGRYFAMDVGFERYNGEMQWEVVTFNQDSNDWQYVSDKIIAKESYKSIRFYCLYYKNENTAYFDGLQLYKEEFGQSYVYDDKGNIESVRDSAEDKSDFEFDSNNDLIKATSPKGNSFTYHHDKKHNLLDAKSAENVVYSFKYDSEGNPITSKTGDDPLIVNDTLSIKSNATYTISKNYIDTLTDASGNTVNYNYNETKGTLGSFVDAKGKKTSYVYDPNLDRLDSVSKTVDGQTVTNSYGYEDDSIDTITHNGFNYNFDYDSLGNNTEVKVGTQSLINNIFKPRTSILQKSIYGNKDFKEYLYDDEDRVSVEKYDGATKFKYEYNAEGNLGYHEDLVNKINYRYIYDLSGRLGKVEESNGNSIKYSYDLDNNISNNTENIGKNVFSTAYGYDKDSKQKTITYDGNSIGYNYDVLGRLDAKTISTGTASYKTDYDYEKGKEDKSTTTKVSKITNKGKVISYTYDGNGNIETITGDSKQTKYCYNELNELEREDNQVLNKTIVYTYDKGGNLTSKKEYPYTTGIPGTATKTNSYIYGDSNWKDKLTSFNGKDITYDAIGNPLKYNEDTYTWEHGRQLAGMTASGNELTFKYNASGIRTQKIVDKIINKVTNKVTTNYHLVGDKVTYEDNGKDKIYYTYDSSGHLVSMNLSTKNLTTGVWYDGVEYYYIRNAQGDIIGLFDKAGEAVVCYTYDSWGKLISTTGTAASTVGVKNPYRYRGYRYDTETGLYYLQSRYYNAEWGRFVNADGILGQTGELLGHNMFAYSKNNPINMSDPSGYKALTRDFREFDPMNDDSYADGLYSSADDAAEDFGRTYNTSSIREKREYGAHIYKVKGPKSKGQYAFTAPTVGTEVGVDFNRIQKPKGTVALIHTHANYTYDNEGSGLFNENFSDVYPQPCDTTVARSFNLPLYLVTPGGKLKSYSYGKWFGGPKCRRISYDMPVDPDVNW